MWRNKLPNLIAVKTSNLSFRTALAVALLGIVWPLFIYFSAIPAALTLTHGFAAYYGAARILLEGDIGRVHDVAWFHARLAAFGFGTIQDVVHQNPPTLGLLMVPLAGFSPLVARRYWTLLNVIFLVATWLSISGAARAHVRLAENWNTRLLALGTILPLLGSTWENVRWGQVYLLITLCMLLALWAVLNGRDVLAGLLITPVLISKPYYAVFFLLVLLMHRRWRAVGSGLIGTALIIIATWPLTGLDAWSKYLAFVPTINNLPYVAHTSQQTINGLTHRLLAYHPIWNPSPLVAIGPVYAIGFRIVITTALLSLVLLNIRKRDNLFYSSALLLTIAPIAAPVAEPHHFALTVVGLGYLLLLQDAPISGWLLAAFALLAVPWPIRQQSLWVGGWALLAYPRLYGTLLLLIALLRVNLHITQDPVLVKTGGEASGIAGG